MPVINFNDVEEVWRNGTRCSDVWRNGVRVWFEDEQIVASSSAPSVAFSSAPAPIPQSHPYDDARFAGLINTTTDWMPRDYRPAVGQTNRHFLLDGDDDTLADYSNTSWDGETITIERPTKLRAVVFTRYWDARSISYPSLLGLPDGYAVEQHEIGTRKQRFIYTWGTAVDDREITFKSPAGADDNVSIEIWEEPVSANQYADDYVQEGYMQ